jgi:predicted short-subunit dehydrogenase-like oxidoreductase (DUF2520 family)
MKGIKSMSIIGTGNVAFHLGNSFIEVGIPIISVYGRNPSKSKELAELWRCNVAESISEIETEFVLVCVTDSSVEEVISHLPLGCKVAYTSGSVDLVSFTERKNTGVFYPLQTFSREKSVNIFEVPMLIEADSNDFAHELFDLAWVVSRNVHFASSVERKKYHLAAVWANNFTNHLIYTAKNYLDNENLNWKILMPLLKETVDKLKYLDPFDAQTGPARRNDLTTIEAQEKMQEGMQKELYALLTKSIQETYSKHD